MSDITFVNDWETPSDSIQIPDLLTKPNIQQYRLLSEGVPYTIEIGPHGGIHYVIGGDPGGDLFTSPADPAFWVHHGQMDRLWTTW